MFAARQPFFLQPPAAAGGFGNNARFPGSGATWLSVASTTNLITWKATTGFTIEYWIYPVTWPGAINPGPGNHDAGATNYWSFGPGANGTLEFYYWGPNQQFIRTATNAMTLNNWYNVAMVATTTGTTSTISLYINGARQQTQLNNAGSFTDTKTVTNGVVATGTPFRMGAYSTNRWNAFVDNIRVSNINRYSGASYTLATAPFTSDANTQLYLICDGTNGQTTFPDSSSFARTVTNNSNLVTVSNLRPNHT